MWLCSSIQVESLRRSLLFFPCATSVMRNLLVSSIVLVYYSHFTDEGTLTTELSNKDKLSGLVGLLYFPQIQ